MIGKNHQGILVTVAESKSRFVLAGQLHSKHSEGMTKKISSLLHPHKHKYSPVTCDNGKESGRPDPSIRTGSRYLFRTPLPFLGAGIK